MASLSCFLLKNKSHLRIKISIIIYLSKLKTCPQSTGYEPKNNIGLTELETSYQQNHFGPESLGRCDMNTTQEMGECYYE